VTGAPSPLVSPTEFDELFERCCNWGRWGTDDQRGTLNHLTPERTVAAARLIESGTSVSCARVVDVDAAVDNPDPAEHEMTRLPVLEAPDQKAAAAFDRLAIACHGEVYSHVDALCHIAYRGKLYNDVDVDVVGVHGAERLGLEHLGSGITGRGVLLDVAALRGRPWLEAGETIDADDLERAEEAAGVTVGPGDVVLLRTGHALRREAQGPWDAAAAKAGLHPRAMPWLKDREIAAIGFDGEGDAAPHPVPSEHVPIHVLGINAMGLITFDALSFEALARACAERDRCAFFFTATPLRLVGGTGCAINPIAIF
jgi:kynurenine formamidase